MGLKSALNDSQNRRTALLDKLREAQDTLRVCSWVVCGGGWWQVVLSLVMIVIVVVVAAAELVVAEVMGLRKVWRRP